jgi:hypothetical protein
METEKHTPYYELLDAIGQPECPICRLAIRSADRFLQWYSYEHVNDIEIREQVRQALGFCHRHAWRLADDHSPLGTAITYYDVLGELLHLIRTAKQGGGLFRNAAGIIRSKTEATAACLACAAQDDAERRYLSLLVETLRDDAAVQQLYVESDGVCLPHFRAALGLRPADKALKVLVAVQESRIERIRARLEQIVRKSDYRARERITQEDIASLPAALSQAVGRRALR